MHGFEKMVEIIVTVILLFLVPLQYAGAKADVVSRSYVMTETAYFVDSVRNTGCLTTQMYQEYLKKLAVTGQVYDIEITHYQKLLNETESGYQTYYHGVYTEELLKQLFSEEDRYEFLPGDFIRLQVKSKSPSFAEKFSLFFRAEAVKNAAFQEVQVIYGGRIRNETR